MLTLVQKIWIIDFYQNNKRELIKNIKFVRSERSFYKIACVVQINFRTTDGTDTVTIVRNVASSSIQKRTERKFDEELSGEK